MGLHVYVWLCVADLSTLASTVCRNQYINSLKMLHQSVLRLPEKNFDDVSYGRSEEYLSTLVGAGRSRSIHTPSVPQNFG